MADKNKKIRSRKDYNTALNEKKEGITKEELFLSPYFTNYLHKMIQMISGRYNRPVKLQMINDSNNHLAYTDNARICINIGDDFFKGCDMQSMADYIYGLMCHEVGHILYTDFVGEEKRLAAFDNQKWLPRTPQYVTDDDKQRESQFWQAAKDKNKLQYIKQIAHNVSNILEDVYIENQLMSKYAGLVRSNIQKVRGACFKYTLTYKEGMQKYNDGEIPLFNVFLSLMQAYANYGIIRSGGIPLEGECIDYISDVIDIIDNAITNPSATDRMDCVNRIILHCWDMISDSYDFYANRNKEMEQLIKAMQQDIDNTSPTMGSMPTGNSSPVPQDSDKQSVPNGSSAAREKTKARLKQTKGNGANGNKTENKEKTKGNGAGGNGTEGEEETEGNGANGNGAEGEEEAESNGAGGNGTEGEEEAEGEEAEGNGASGNGTEGEEEAESGKTKGNGAEGDEAEGGKTKGDEEAENNGASNYQNFDDDGGTTENPERIPYHETDEIIDEGDGEVEYIGGYETSPQTLNLDEILTRVADDKITEDREREYADSLQDFSDTVPYTNNHKNVNKKIHRKAVVTPEMKDLYAEISKAVLPISKKIVKELTAKLKISQRGSKETGLTSGKRIQSTAIYRNNGRIFYARKLPNDSVDMAIGYIGDESVSTSGERIKMIRATAVLVQDFCSKLQIPHIIYGHSTNDDSVELFSYCEFESKDKNDKYRLADMKARKCNRDGAAIQYVAERLLTRPERVKLLFVVSDGQPYHYGYSGSAAESDLKAIKKLYEQKGITFVCAAIGDDRANIRRIYDDINSRKSVFLDISDLEKLPKVFINFLKEQVKDLI